MQIRGHLFANLARDAHSGLLREKGHVPLYPLYNDEKMKFKEIICVIHRVSEKMSR